MVDVWRRNLSVLVLSGVRASPIYPGMAGSRSLHEWVRMAFGILMDKSENAVTQEEGWLIPWSFSGALFRLAWRCCIRIGSLVPSKEGWRTGVGTWLLHSLNEAYSFSTYCLFKRGSGKEAEGRKHIIHDTHSNRTSDGFIVMNMNLVPTSTSDRSKSLSHCPSALIRGISTARE
ncbi:hypothetical protein VTI74DRAFT_6062 [Chaetomium olivicolor]